MQMDEGRSDFRPAFSHETASPMRTASVVAICPRGSDPADEPVLVVDQLLELDGILDAEFEPFDEFFRLAAALVRRQLDLIPFAPSPKDRRQQRHVIPIQRIFRPEYRAHRTPQSHDDERPYNGIKVAQV